VQAARIIELQDTDKRDELVGLIRKHNQEGKQVPLREPALRIPQKGRYFIL
jgi:hypothetical protein